MWLFQRGVSEGPGLLLRKLRGEINFVTHLQTRSPAAPCKQYRERKQPNGFSYYEWQSVRANRPATCMACDPKSKEPERNFQPKGKVRCAQCRRQQIKEWFPQAQLKQQQAEIKRRCLFCLRTLEELRCAICGENKPVDQFQTTMVTFPQNCAACTSCQNSIKDAPNRSPLDGSNVKPATCTYLTERAAIQRATLA